MNLKKFKNKPRFHKFNAKTGLLQVIFLIVELLALLICIVLVISIYILTLPEVDLIATSIPQNPRDTIDLKEFPTLKINMNVIGYVTNRNLIPLPISILVKGSIDSDVPSDRIISGVINNIVLMPLKKQVVAVPVTGNINLFESKARSLAIVLDACGVTTEEEGRAPINFHLYSDVYLGYGVLSVFLKTLNFKVELPCPLIESKFSSVVMGAVNDLFY